jgi:uncharacterized membrane protein (DUF485 family)
VSVKNKFSVGFKNEKVETLIDIWLRVEYVVYWTEWLGSMAIWNISTWVGFGIGLLSFVIWFVILNIFSRMNGDGWVWNW